jgi:hypothetical protein
VLLLEALTRLNLVSTYHIRNCFSSSMRVTLVDEMFVEGLKVIVVVTVDLTFRPTKAKLYLLPAELLSRPE